MVIAINTYILLILSIICAFANNLLLHKFSNRGLEGLKDVLLFNSCASAVWIVILFSKGIYSGLDFDLSTVSWGIFYGLVSAAFLLCKMQALASGPVSLTSFIGCSSLLISTAFGVFILHEDASMLQWLGVLLLIISLFFIVAPKGGKSDKSWKFWCAGFFVCSAATGIIFKMQQRSSSASNVDEMLMIAALTASLTFLITSFLIGKDRKPHVPRSAIPYVITCGVCACLYNRLNVTLSGALPGVVFFPTFNGSVIILSTLAGVFLFREKLVRSQWIGMLIGVCALMLASGSIG